MMWQIESWILEWYASIRAAGVGVLGSSTHMEDKLLEYELWQITILWQSQGQIVNLVHLDHLISKKE